MGLYVRRPIPNDKKLEAEKEETKRAHVRGCGEDQEAKKTAIEELTTLRKVRNGECRPPDPPGHEFQDPVYDRLKRCWKAHRKQTALEAVDHSLDRTQNSDTSESSNAESTAVVSISNSSWIIWDINLKIWMDHAEYDEGNKSSTDLQGSPSPLPSTNSRKLEKAAPATSEQIKAPAPQNRAPSKPQQYQSPHPSLLEKHAEKRIAVKGDHATPKPGINRQDTGGSMMQTLHRTLSMVTDGINKLCS